MKRLLYLIIPVLILSFGCKTMQTTTDSSVDKVPDDFEGITENVFIPELDSTTKYNEFGMPILLEYSPISIDLGKVRKGEKRDLSFKYTNISKEVVEIEVVTACSCTETDYTKAKLQPGESGEILLVFDSKSKDKSETIDVDIILKNEDPKTGYPIVDRIGFKYELVE